MAKRSALVCQQLESVSSVVLEEYQDIIRHYIRGRNGVYALYKGEKLYYVGLATNLRGRLKQHLKDRHKGLWDRFSVYLTIGEHHIKERWNRSCCGFSVRRGTSRLASSFAARI
jgi:hypothetical protein